MSIRARGRGRETMNRSIPHTSANDRLRRFSQVRFSTLMNYVNKTVLILRFKENFMRGVISQFLSPYR